VGLNKALDDLAPHHQAGPGVHPLLEPWCSVHVVHIYVHFTSFKWKTHRLNRDPGLVLSLQENTQLQADPPLLDVVVAPGLLRHPHRILDAIEHHCSSVVVHHLGDNRLRWWKPCHGCSRRTSKTHRLSLSKKTHRFTCRSLTDRECATLRVCYFESVATHGLHRNEVAGVKVSCSHSLYSTRPFCRACILLNKALLQGMHPQLLLLALSLLPIGPSIHLESRFCSQGSISLSHYYASSYTSNELNEHKAAIVLQRPLN
jgi:hypothetical protein